MENKENTIEEKDAESIIKRHTYWAVGGGLIPLPLVDIAAVTAIQLDMLKQICSFYKIDYTEEQGKAWIVALASSTISSIVARFGASIVKTIPIVGSVIGATSMAVISGASTHALGKVVSNHFESGGTLESFNKEKIKEFYEENLKEGKKVAKNLKDKYLKLIETPEGKEKERKIGSRLKDLEDSRKQKLISEEEYEKIRGEIIKSLIGDN
jgi:uncharacterized protein (DUF697 family)